MLYTCLRTYNNHCHCLIWRENDPTTGDGESEGEGGEDDGGDRDDDLGVNEEGEGGREEEEERGED